MMGNALILAVSLHVQLQNADETIFIPHLFMEDKLTFNG
jgi:hypothetical protein